MRCPWRLAMFAALLCPVVVEARETKSAGCEASVGAWEFTPGPGRAVMLKEGTTYHVVYLVTLGGESYGSASTCTCETSAGKLLWSCDVRFSLQQAQIGTKEKYEWVFDGETIQHRSISPDGQRGDVISLRRAK